MNGMERIRETFIKKKKLKVMTHVIGGYPDLEMCENIIYLMAQKGVDLIEIQLPFSDPIADGPVIVQANHHALKKGVSTESVFTMLKRVRKTVSIPLLIMSYLNPLYSFGIEKVIRRVQSIGLDGFIVPDCPIEETELRFPELCRKNGLAFVPLITPATGKERIFQISQYCDSPFVYAVLRFGVTGRKTMLDNNTVEYLEMIKTITKRYVAAGFGIRDSLQLNALSEKADCGVVGSALIQKISHSLEEGSDPVLTVKKFLDELL
ncbi:MAG: tryptophan synthase subunit alpha [Chitinispirillia bacterium]|jgi:tryptophan synthase alpha chain